MKDMITTRFIVAVCVGLTAPITAQPLSPSPASSAATHPRKFENQNLAIALLPGWTAAPIGEQALEKTGNRCVVSFTHGKYVLSINPVFTHASGVDGGRINEILGSQPSVFAVIGDDDIMDYEYRCFAWRNSSVGKTIGLQSIYIDAAKSKDCTLPVSARGVWFASYSSGEGPESDYSITLTYNSTNLNALPHWGAPELTHVLREVTTMLGTLRLKPPIVVSKIVPSAAAPGATVTIYGSGFKQFDRPEIFFSEYPNNFVAAPEVAADGHSMTFQVPASVQIISCPAGKVDVHEWCVPISTNHSELSDCPPASDRRTNFCGAPMPSGSYHIQIRAGDVFTQPVPFSVTAPEPGAVSIQLLYPNYLVRQGETITVVGSGFTPSGNTVQIGAAAISGLASPDGKRLTFAAPAPAGESLVPRLHYYQASVSNSGGRSNAIVFSYR